MVKHDPFIVPIPEETYDMAIADILRSAVALRRGEMDPVEAARCITKLRLETSCPDDDVFMAFRVVESDTDRFPLGEARYSCAPEYLERADAELATYLKEATPDLLKACDELIKWCELKTDEQAGANGSSR